MSLEQLIEKAIVALESNTAAHIASANTPAAAAAAPAAAAKPAGATVTPIKPGITPSEGEPTVPVVDFDVLKVAAGKVVATMGKPFAKKIIKDVGGAADLASVKPNKHHALMVAFEAALAPKEEPADDDDDSL